VNQLLGHRLKLLGLRDVDRILTHTNRTVMVSLARRVLRLHRGYASAPDRVLRAVVRFLDPRLPRGHRRAAERELLEFPVETFAPRPPAERRERPRPGDVMLLQRLTSLHQRLNLEHFSGVLGAIPVRLSGRMRTRLGELVVDLGTGRPEEIAIGRHHVQRHPWSEVEHTMLHEMVHQWQAESGLPVDHGPVFKRKARELGIEPRARRHLPHSAGEAAGAKEATVGCARG